MLSLLLFIKGENIFHEFYNHLWSFLGPFPAIYYKFNNPMFSLWVAYISNNMDLDQTAP